MMLHNALRAARQARWRWLEYGLAAAPRLQSPSQHGVHVLSLFEEELSRIEKRIDSGSESDLPTLFRRIPLEIFGQLLLDVPVQYPNIRALLPTMVSDQVQQAWTGTHGEALMTLSLAITRTILTGHATLSGKPLESASILDYGCGWGRLTRLLYKFAPVDNIYAVDPWDESIKECQKHGVKGHLAMSDYVPRSLPFERRFDLVIAFSVFTHLSEKTTRVVLTTLRDYVAADGVLLMTIRPREYWHVHGDRAASPPLMKRHDESGFAFWPHNRPPVDGDVTYGDTSMTLEYLEAKYPQWSVELVELNAVDPYQVFVFLKPRLG